MPNKNQYEVLFYSAKQEADLARKHKYPGVLMLPHETLPQLWTERCTNFVKIFGLEARREGSDRKKIATSDIKSAYDDAEIVYQGDEQAYIMLVNAAGVLTPDGARFCKAYNLHADATTLRVYTSKKRAELKTATTPQAQQLKLI